MEYTLIRSSRRTLSIQIDREGQLIVRAPRLYPVYLIERFIEAKKVWIEKCKRKAEDRKQKVGEKNQYSEVETREMKKRLMEYLIHRIPELWEGRGLPKYTTIKITRSERRWGSCSGKNGLCFSYRLAEYLESSPGFIDAVIIHELAHLREKHHQASFWNLVYSMMPEYESIMKNRENLD